MTTIKDWWKREFGKEAEEDTSYILPTSSTPEEFYVSKMEAEMRMMEAKMLADRHTTPPLISTTSITGGGMFSGIAGAVALGTAAGTMSVGSKGTMSVGSNPLSAYGLQVTSIDKIVHIGRMYNLSEDELLTLLETAAKVNQQVKEK